MASRKHTKTKRVPKQEAFLAAYSQTGNITAAAKLAKVDRRMHYDWLKGEEYAERFAAAHEEAADLLEAEARRRAVDGVEEPVFHKGEQVATVRKYSDSLLIFLLKGARPEKFRERFDHQHAGKDGGPLQMMIVEELAELPGAANDPPQDNPAP